MRGFIFTLLTCSAVMSGLALMYMAAAPLLSKRYSEKGKYYAWLIIVIGMIIPFRPQWSEAVFNISVPNIAETPTVPSDIAAPVNYYLTTPGNSAAVSATAHAADMFMWRFVFAVWLTGALAFLIYHLAKNRYYVKMAKRWSERVTDERTLNLFQQLKTEMGITKQIGLYHCPCEDRPMMIGMFKPVIFLPANGITQDELSFILKHELVHYQRKDLIYKYLVLTATAIHWFNPVAHLMANAIAVLCETSCDDEVIRSADADTRLRYSETIIGVAKSGSILRTALSTNFYGGKKGMKNRIASIMDTNKKKAGITLICAAFIVTLGTGYMLAVTDPAETDDNSDDTHYYAVEQDAVTPAPDSYAEIDGFEIYDLYRNLGVSCVRLDGILDINGDPAYTMMYDGQPVREIWDETAGMLTTHNAATGFLFKTPEGAIDLYPIYENGVMIGFRKSTQEEYDRRTQERLQLCYKYWKTHEDGPYEFLSRLEQWGIDFVPEDADN